MDISGNTSQSVLYALYHPGFDQVFWSILDVSATYEWA